jgi:hypothetical protein
MLKVRVLSIGPSHRQHVLATATVEMIDSEGATITVADVRLLENKLGQRWVALPSFSVPRGGRDFQYLPTVQLSPTLMRELSERVLSAFAEEGVPRP